MKKNSKRTANKAKNEKRPEPLGCLVVGGLRQYGHNLSFSVRHRLGFDLDIVEAATKEELVEALAKRHPPLCILEYIIPIGATAKSATTLMAEGLPREVARKLAGQVMEAVPTHAVMDDVHAASPDTRFIIACNNKGYDVVKAHIDDYTRHPAVIKTMGVMNGAVNMRYLYKLFSRTYAGRVWKPTF